MKYCFISEEGAVILNCQHLPSVEKRTVYCLIPQNLHPFNFFCDALHRYHADGKPVVPEQHGGWAGWRGEGEEAEGGAGHAEGDEVQELCGPEEGGWQREDRGWEM